MRYIQTLLLLSSVALTINAAGRQPSPADINSLTHEAICAAPISTVIEHVDQTIEATFTEGSLKTAADSAAAFSAPYYSLPAGVFAEAYRGGTGLSRFYMEFNNGVSSLSPLVLPPYATIEWQSSSLNPALTPAADSISWNYNYAVTNDKTTNIYANTVNGSASMTMPGMAYGLAYSSMTAPAVTFGTGDNSRSYRPDSHLTTMPRTYTDHLSFVRFDPNLVPRQGTYRNTYSEDSLYVTTYSNYVTNAYRNFGFFIPKPQAMYGFDGVMFSGIIQQYESDELRFSVYEVYGRAKSNTNAGGSLYQYNIGERLGGGYIKREDITPVSNNYQTVFIPCKEQLGLFEYENYLNIDCDIVVMFEGYKCEIVDNQLSGDIIVPVMMVSYNPYIEPEGVFRYQSRESIPAVFYSSNLLGFYNDEHQVVYPIYCGSGIRLITGNLSAYEDNESYYTFDVPTNGSSKTFDFEPTVSIDENGTISGKGLYDWYDYEIEAINESTGLQTVTVTVNALPDGVAKRTAKMKVSIPGAEQIINITQSNQTGIDCIINDTYVESSRYFDMTGREMNHEPESGIFVRRDVMSDGSIYSVKIVK